MEKLTAECEDEQETRDGEDAVTLNEHLAADVVKCNRGLVMSCNYTETCRQSSLTD